MSKEAMSIDIQISEAKPLFKASTFVAYKHRHQFRKGTKPVPYINHPIAVAKLLVTVGNVSDPETIVATFFTTRFEDTETTLLELEHEFGPAVPELVAELSDDKSLPKDQRKRLKWSTRRRFPAARDSSS